MKFQLATLTFAFGAFTASLPSTGSAWGGRGHAAICEAARFLVQEKGLRDYLKSRPHMMGHLCNVPDIYWKSLGKDSRKLGDPTHFIDVEITGLKIQDVPLDYRALVKTFEGKPNQAKKGETIKNFHEEFGSLWWRADQFFRRATETASAWKTAAAPSGGKEEQDENHVFNKSAYDFVVNLGLMGHFVGDASMPFHGTVDYDGYEVGHGGIHAFYEDAGVAAQDHTLTKDVVEAAQKMQKLASSKKASEKKKVEFLTASGVIEKMKALQVITYAEIPKLLAMDPVKKRSSVTKKEGEKDLRQSAEREDVEKVSKKFRTLMVPELARSAALLAKLWDEAYMKVGQPKMAVYKSYKYPFTPDFVPPDYFATPGDFNSEQNR